MKNIEYVREQPKIEYKGITIYADKYIPNEGRWVHSSKYRAALALLFPWIKKDKYIGAPIYGMPSEKPQHFLVSYQAFTKIKQAIDNDKDGKLDLQREYL